MRKFYFVFPLLVNIFFNISAQIGIGTPTIQPGIVLQVDSNNKGVSLPNVSLTSTSVFAPVTGTPVTGLTVYNTTIAGAGTTAVSPGLYYWDNSIPAWVKVQQRNASETALFSNQNTTSNINSGSGVMTDLFANVRFNNNPALYQKVDNSTLKINETGYYKLILNLDLFSNGNRDNFGIEILVNNLENIVTDNLYVPGRAISAQPNSRAFVVYVPINVAGYTLRVRSYEIDPNTDVYFRNANTSTISIEKIR
ncbi:hypothetical protein [Chryseobacterium daeguense]|uniref:hypothetical protein n=1 Tax=Chryseobacterium daeguense TaxID=412438 RepID=UPI000413226A|nr:hypothetical protein [Chryseobacterium daeguense]